jgi:aryl-alcohol dehydrogenase-like predicted oxidoreductase
MPDLASSQHQDGMKKRRMGSTGIEIVPLALGGNVFGWTADEATSLSLIDLFVERGFSLIDTADVYSTWVDGHSGGESEAILGKWLRRVRIPRSFGH